MALPQQTTAESEDTLTDTDQIDRVRISAADENQTTEIEKKVRKREPSELESQVMKSIAEGQELDFAALRLPLLLTIPEARLLLGRMPHSTFYKRQRDPNTRIPVVERGTRRFIEPYDLKAAIKKLPKR
ncbi:MAG: hypothetical protein OJF48_003574 [Afipia sp.]|nr:MAG: hypothetical protein OJF48_003574 [Afipia sp.]